ncbi:MAG TPA: hypothetical protein PLG06_00360 [Anaerolineae bacterium]|nr:hypothetical protein [Anaerolineae bacterium]
MSDSTTVRDGFIAMMIHDWCKTVLNADGKWTGHQKFDPQAQGGVAFGPSDAVTGTQLRELFGAQVVEYVKKHEEIRWGAADSVVAAIGIADRVQKAMYQLQDAHGTIISERELPEVLKLRLFPYPPFYPYYGEAVTAWDPHLAAQLLRDAVYTIQTQSATLPILLAAQRPFRRFPHTTYMPHLSLELHQRFAATLFLLVNKQLRQLQAAGRPFTDLTNLHFSVITAVPDPLELFYRLRDVTAYRKATRDLRADLYKSIFQAECTALPGASAAANPFEYYTFDGLVLVYDEAQTVLDAIQASADRRHTLRSLTVEVIEYSIALNGGNYFSPRHTPEVQRFTILEQQSQVFPTTTLARCQRCNIPVAEPLPSGLCESCETLMQKPSRIKNLETVATDETGKTQRLAYVFLTLPEDLHAESARVAQLHLDRMIEDARRLRHPEDPAWADPNLPRLRPTKMGLFEYLEAVLSVESMQREIRKKKPGGVKRIAEFPRLTIYVMREGLFLEFFEILEETTAQMHLDLKIRAILCDLKTPVWSLMDRFTDHPREQERRTLVDTGGGEIVMFTDEEVKAIRDLAGWNSRAAARTQLQALVQMARKGSLEELCLEIDRRCKKGKIWNNFAEALKGYLRNLKLETSRTGDDTEFANREKRALFIKNVADLGDFKGQ